MILRWWVDDVALDAEASGPEWTFFFGGDELWTGECSNEEASQIGDKLWLYLNAGNYFVDECQKIADDLLKELRQRQGLISAACDAEEKFDLDDLEDFANKSRES